MKKAVKILSVLLCLCMMLSLGACSGDSGSSAANPDAASGAPGGEASQADEGETSAGGVLRIGAAVQVESLGHPGTTTTSQELFASSPAVETLCRYDQTGTLTPWLCKSYETDSDALTLTVVLNEGIEFHDGTPFNAEAVKANWEDFIASGRNELASIESIEVTDEYTVVAHLNAWDNAIADNALYLAGQMVSPTYLEENGAEAAARNPVGTGPYVFKEWQTGVSTVYGRNDNYWIEGQPYLDGIEIIYFADATTLTSAFSSGEVDVLYQANSDQYAMFNEAEGISSINGDYVMGTSFLGLFFDCTSETSPTADLNVRKAICYGIDMDAICDAIQGNGHIVRTNQWSPAGSWSWNPDTEGYPYSVEDAKAALAESAYPDGCTVKFVYTTSPMWKMVGEIMQAQLSEVGITVELEEIDQTRSDEMSGIGGHWDGVFMSAGRGEPDIAPIYARTFMEDGVRYVGGMLHPDDVAELINGARSATTFEEKAEISKELSKTIIDDYCMVDPVGCQLFITYAYDYVQDSGITLNHANIWTPESAKIVK